MKLQILNLIVGGWCLAFAFVAIRDGQIIFAIIDLICACSNLINGFTLDAYHA